MLVQFPISVSLSLPCSSTFALARMGHFLGALCALAFITVASNAHLTRRAGVVPSPTDDPVDMTFAKGGTYPRANFLVDGSLIGAYAATVGEDKSLTLVKSTDDSASWSFLGTAATRPTASSDLENPYPLQLPGGRVLLAYRNHDKDPDSGESTAFRITVSYSDDIGANWEFLFDAATTTAEFGFWEPLLRSAQGGSLQIYYSRETSLDDQDSIERSSPLMEVHFEVQK